PYIKISLNEKWPRVFSTRQFENDGGRYFGPYASAKSVRHTLELLKRIFRYCSPKSVITGKKPRPCFDFHIQRCIGACSGEITAGEYRRIIDQVILFLEGKQEVVVRQLRRQMEEASDALEFEKATYLRDQLQAVESVTEGQKITSTLRGDEDVIAFARDNNEACVQIFFIRGGKLIGKEHFILEGTLDEENNQIMAGFINQYYGSASYVPPEILVQYGPEDSAVIQTWLKSKRGRKVMLHSPQRGEKKKLVDMVAENAVQLQEQMKAKWLADTGKTAAALMELQEQLKLPRLPNRVECYDISDIRGTSAVGSMVVFDNGQPKPSSYRRFRIKTVGSIDDYAMTKEVLGRRFKKVTSEDGSSWAVIPDLVLIDGGKGHLSSAMEVMQELGIDSVPLASIAKENEDLFLPGVAGPLILPRNSQALYLLQRIRDEAHRFALSYHLKVRRKSTIVSALDVPGIGPKRKRALIKQFGSVKGIKEASIEEIAAVPGITRALAESVKAHL
ncbi:MAG: excinuclease ABC subunit UvrC, partial [Dehalococcoidia bacterium]